MCVCGDGGGGGGGGGVGECEWSSEPATGRMSEHCQSVHCEGRE